MRQRDPTKESGSVEGTVPSQWFLDLKAENQKLREALSLRCPTDTWSELCQATAALGVAWARVDLALDAHRKERPE